MNVMINKLIYVFLTSMILILTTFCCLEIYYMREDSNNMKEYLQSQLERRVEHLEQILEIGD